MAKTRLAKVVLTIKGVWSPTVEYEKLDLVNYLGSSYIAKRDNIGVTPVEGDDWSLSAEKGGRGDQGDKIYLHIAYANSEDGETDFTTSPVVDRIYTYLGQYSDYTPEGSIVPSKYVWSKLSEEAARVAAELLRVAAENKRVAAETARTSAESLRDNAESDRNTAEETRVSDEQSRVSAEINRVSEESARQSAETVRVSSETDRQKAEVSRVDKEKKRVSAETDRAAAETKRIEGEQHRVSAEQSRSDAETVRVDNESARKIAEETRVSNESARKTAETSRVSAENTRDTSETKRVNAETSRVNAETVRVNAENARVLAEQERVTDTQAAISRVNTAASNAQTIADTVQSKLDAGDFVGPQGVQGIPGPKGDDGYSPTASVSKEGTTTTISITDKTGTTRATVEDGAKGDKGDPGSDASVTAENIQAALGYAPVKDVQVAGKSVLEGGIANVPIASANRLGVIKIMNAQHSGMYVGDDGNCFISYAINPEIDSRSVQRKTIVCSNLDYAVKAAMCDGKGAAWTADEQKAARERIGIPGDYELIEEITISEAITSFIRESTPDGTPYSLAGFLCVITSPGVDNAIALNQNIFAGGTSLYNYGVRSVDIAVNAKSVFFACVNNKILHAEQYPVNVTYEFSNAIRFAKKFVPDGSPITKVDFNGNIPVNTKISIYGVRV